MNSETVLDLSFGERILIIIIPPILGAFLGWLIHIPTIMEWISKLPFIPFQELLEWVATVDSHWVSVISTILGFIAGIILTLFVFHETLKITLRDDEIKLNVKGKAQTFRKNHISAIYYDGKQLVFLDNGGMELFRGLPDYKKKLVIEAFTQHRYPWSDKDPFEDQYQRWVAAHPDFPQNVNALLSAREQALLDEEKSEAEELRKDLADLGVVIRDNGKKQYVRMVRG